MSNMKIAHTSLVAAGWLALAAMLATAGCDLPLSDPAFGGDVEPGDLPPLPVRQTQAYPEAATGRFVSLVDFEDKPFGGGRGHRQVRQFRIRSGGAGANVKYVVNIARTGVGAMEVSLPVGASLVHRLPKVYSFTGYSLLSVAVYSRSVRDDFKLLLVTDRSGWESYPVLLREGWNTVMMDIRPSQAPHDFDLDRVREIRLRFNAPPGKLVAEEPVVINIDDILLVDNRRDIRPVPEGMRLARAGLDYDLYLPNVPEPIKFRQGLDGLWRPSAHHAAVAIAAAGADAPPAGMAEDLKAMGWHRTGEVSVLEHNPVRVQIANTWYLPAEGGHWKDMDVRRIHWVHTFYPDGRSITNVTARRMGEATVTVTPPPGGIWWDGLRGGRKLLPKAHGPERPWCFLTPSAGANREVHQRNYAAPVTPEIKMGEPATAYGDVGGDGFDESEGCYLLKAVSGHCRFFLPPPHGGLADPVIRVTGPWVSDVTASSEGRALRQIAQLADGSVIFRLPGLLKRRTWVEVTGRAAPPDRK